MEEVDLGVLLALAFQQFVHDLHADLGERGYDDLGRSDGYVFRALDAGALTTSALAERLEMTKQGAGQLVEDMTRRGYLTSRPHPHDARARLQELSERGRGALAAASAFHRRYQRSLVRRHGAEAVAGLRTLLTEMAGPDADPVDPRLRAMHV
ncbi:MAG: MarR family transcriptional regulator [Nocardioides sp.]